MKFVRFVLPFLFTRNWYNGEWEVSKPRLMLFAAAVGLFGVGVVTATILQLPVVYTS